MKTGIIPSKPGGFRFLNRSSIEHFARQFLLDQLGKIQHGQIILADRGQFYTFGQANKEFDV